MIPDAWRSGEAAVLGLGRTGIAAARFLVGEGFQVYASDFSDSDKNAEALAELRSRGVHIDLGSHDLDRIANATLVVTSPGIPPTAPPLVVAQSAGRTIVAELDLALLALQEIPSILVTGTNGKSTTTALIAHILNEAGSSAVAAGNIGYPLIEISQESARPEWLVVEASSYQLHFSSFHTPRIGVLTNLSPDHLEWHGSVEAYREAKKRLFLNASSTSEWILNGDDEAVLELAEEVPGVRRCWSLETKSDSWFDSANETLQLGGEILLQRQQLLLLGDHNVSNALAATLAASAVGVEPDPIARGLGSFRPLKHRLEPVREVGGVLWINDSKATNLSSTEVAVRAMSRPYVLLMGGRGKGESYARLAPLLAPSCRAVVAYGEDATKIMTELGNTLHVGDESTLDAAVQKAGELVAPGEAVLLSPACASFDQFSDFEERGEMFRSLVEAL